MRYSTDLRKRVVDFIKAGGSKAEASRRFSITRATIATQSLAYAVGYIKAMLAALAVV